MIHNVLAFSAPGPIELLVIFVIFLLVFVIPIFLVVWFIRLILRNKKENVRLRLEVSKLANELENSQKQSQNIKEEQSPAESG